MKRQDKTAEDAAQFCSAVACLKIGAWVPWGDIVSTMATSAEAIAMAESAELEAESRGSKEPWAEAEALIRTGWRPRE
jgi:hypothetical protein